MSPSSVEGPSPATVKLAREPRRVHYEKPVYPETERAADVEADVTVPVYVNAKGEVYWASSYGKSPLTEAAVAAVRKWRYEPSDHVARSFSVTIRFRLPHKAIHKMSTEAVVDQWHGEGSARAEAARELDDRGATILPVVIRDLRVGDMERRCGAGYLMGRIGAAARSASDALVALVRETVELGESIGWCEAMGNALANVDHAAFQAELARAVRVRNGALCRQLLRAQHYERDVPPPVFAALEVDGCREAAAFAISSVVDAKALTDLLGAAGQTSAVVRRTAINVIARTVSGMPADDRVRWIGHAMPPLMAGLSDPDKGVRYAAAMAFETLQGDAAAGVPALARALEDPSRDVRWRVLLALTAIGSQARSAGPALLKALESPLPPEENVATGLTDETMFELMQAAVAATGAGKDDARLAAEDEIRAAVVAHAMARIRAQKGNEKRAFSVIVFSETSPPGLVAALAKRGLTPSPGGVQVSLGEVLWQAGDLTTLDVAIGVGMDSGGSAYTVALKDGVWTVIAAHGTWVA